MASESFLSEKKAPTLILLAELQIASHVIMQGLQSTWILEVLILHAVAPKGQVKRPSSLRFMPSIGDPGWSSSLRPRPPLLMRPCSCLGAKDTRHLFLNRLHIKIFNALQFFPLLSARSMKATDPFFLQVEMNFTIKANTNHNHTQRHNSQKTVFVGSPYRMYFKVTK